MASSFNADRFEASPNCHAAKLATTFRSTGVDSCG
jgi:hypothetical protein